MNWSDDENRRKIELVDAERRRIEANARELDARTRAEEAFLAAADARVMVLRAEQAHALEMHRATLRHRTVLLGIFSASLLLIVRAMLGVIVGAG